jgi:hypothetical protein
VRHAATWTVVAAVVGVAAVSGVAQDMGNSVASADPRVGLKAGLHDAGEAAWNLRLVSSLPRPDGFFDVKAPAGDPLPPHMLRDDEPPAGGASSSPPAFTALDFANTDAAFSGTHLFLGNYHGVNIYDISRPDDVTLVTSIVCPGGQGDVSVYGTLLFMSVEQTRGRVDCGTGGVDAPASPERFRGVRIFDISDIRMPRQVAAVQTCRGSHTHTLVTDPKDSAMVYIYGSGTSPARPGEELAGCSDADPKDDPETALFSIDVIAVPVAAPHTARVVSRPRIFADEASGRIDGLWLGGDHGPGTQKTSVTNQCHDITAYPAIGLAAGACSGNGILLDISDPVNPTRVHHVIDEHFAYWHSATFNNDGTKVVFTDEWGGGVRARCLATDEPNWGANAIFELVGRTLRFASYYKLPAPQTAQENCVAHNGSIVPVPGRDIKVQAWYQGGISVFDFTDASAPVEIAFFDRGPLDANRLIVGGYWSAYWYNGYVYGTEMARGLDVFTLTPSTHLSQHEIDAARLLRVDTFNVQHQQRLEWPAHPTVARAYLDQLRRGTAVAAPRLQAVEAVVTRLERGGDPGGTIGADVAMLVRELQDAAIGAPPVDARRLQALSANLEAQLAAHR